MLSKNITWFGREAVLACDGQCRKSWGINNRPRVPVRADDPDSYAYLADDELGDAPDDPGTYEGVRMEGKPAFPPTPEAMNRWCARECERSSVAVIGDAAPRVHDYRKRLYNCPSDVPPTVPPKDT